MTIYFLLPCLLRFIISFFAFFVFVRIFFKRVSKYFHLKASLFPPTSTPRGCAASPSPPRCSRSRFWTSPPARGSPEILTRNIFYITANILQARTDRAAECGVSWAWDRAGRGGCTPPPAAAAQSGASASWSAPGTGPCSCPITSQY